MMVGDGKQANDSDEDLHGIVGAVGLMSVCEVLQTGRAGSGPWTGAMDTDYRELRNGGLR